MSQTTPSLCSGRGVFVGWLTWFASHLDEAGRPSRGLYLNLQLRDLLLELSHGGDVVGFPQPNRHHLFFTLQRGGVGVGGETSQSCCWVLLLFFFLM